MTGVAPSAGRRRNLTQTVIDALRERIESGALKVGERLPTEQALVAEFGVSRTVLREAVAGLKAEGLLEPRQGSGVYVRRPSPPANLHFLGDMSEGVPAVIDALELRTAVEIEAAGLAAQRCTPAQEQSIRDAYRRIGAAVADGTSTETADYDFHCAIAEATNNRHFREFLDFLGRRTIPRNQLRPTPDSPGYAGYMAQLQAEHAEIMEAISARDAEGAREAMRVHLRGSLDRYRDLLKTNS